MPRKGWIEKMLLLWLRNINAVWSESVVDNVENFKILFNENIWTFISNFSIGYHWSYGLVP